MRVIRHLVCWPSFPTRLSLRLNVGLIYLIKLESMLDLPNSLAQQDYVNLVLAKFQGAPVTSTRAEQIGVPIFFNTPSDGCF